MICSHHRVMAAHLILLSLVLSVAGADLTPLETMADVTNDFGVCVLQIIASPSSNTVFSPYGLVSMALLVYEGSTGQTAAEIYNTLHLPWHRDIVRIGFRDLQRYLRSYFSSEGFLKGLVLSKANVPLQTSYVEVLRFYGFQMDNTITQPVLTTQAAISNREKDSNDTLTTITTNLLETTTFFTSPETTTMLAMSTKPTKGTSFKKPNKNNMATTGTGSMTTPMSTTSMKKTSVKKPNKKNMASTTLPFFTTEATVIDTTTYGITMKNTRPDVQGMTTPQAATTPSKSEETTIVNETTKRETLTTERMEENITTIKMTNTLPSKTTKKVEITTEDMEVTTDNQITTLINHTINEGMFSEETNKTTEAVNLDAETYSTTTDMDVMTLSNKMPPELESMNMVLDRKNSTEYNETKGKETTLITNLDNEMSTEETENPNTVPDLVSNKEPLQEVYSQEAITDTITISTMFVDSAIPLDDFVIVTTPEDMEIMTQKDTSMLEEFILTEDSKEQIKFPEVNRRSTKNPATKSPLLEYTIPLNNLYTSIEEQKVNQIDNPVKPINKDNYSHSSVGSFNINDVDTAYVDMQNPMESMTEDFESLTDQKNTTDSLTEGSYSEEENIGFPTLEPDRIIFPTNKSPRLSRAVKMKERPAALGNWVGSAAGWRPSPTDQWFWTYGGDKLVPVLTYSAYIPWADLPILGSCAIQLPLDDPRYTLMIMLPKNARGLKQMLYSLQWYPIRNILKLFKPTPVYAVVPTFTIIKHINLTPALHKLGIRSMFEAYQANLHEMSAEPNLYVRTIEQLITISVQKYYTNPKWLEVSSEQVNQHFLATHPFAYFVVDIETKVVLVAGTIVDPTLRNL